MFGLRTCTLLALLVLHPSVLLCHGAETSHSSQTAGDEEGFVSLFDGKTLDGWWPHTGVPAFHVGGKWEVVDGVIVGQQDPPDRGGFLATKDVFGDFEIRLEVKMDYPNDSGVFLRMGEDGMSHQVTLDNRPDGQFGKIYLPWTQGMVHDSPDGIQAFKQGQWNEVVIRMEGEPARIQFWLNGVLVTDFQHTVQTTKGVPRQGYIALQVHPTVENMKHFDAGNKVRFRNIRLKTFDSERD